MPKYDVYVQEVHSVRVEVEASDIFEAKKKAKEYIATQGSDIDYSTDSEYSYTLPENEWEVKELRIIAGTEDPQE